GRSRARPEGAWRPRRSWRGEYSRGRIPVRSRRALADGVQVREGVDGSADDAVPVGTGPWVSRDDLRVQLEVVVRDATLGVARVADVADDGARGHRAQLSVGGEMRVVDVPDGSEHRDGFAAKPTRRRRGDSVERRTDRRAARCHDVVTPVGVITAGVPGRAEVVRVRVRLI